MSRSRSRSRSRRSRSRSRSRRSRSRSRGRPRRRSRSRDRSGPTSRPRQRSRSRSQQRRRRSRSQPRQRNRQREPELEVDTVHHGYVKSIKPYGCFVSLESYTKEGLVHISELAQGRVENVEDVVSINDHVRVRVIEISPDGKVSLSIKGVDEPGYIGGRSGGGRRSQGADTFPELYSVHRGTVASIRDYGAFIEIPGFSKQGMCHISQLGKYRVESVGDMVAQNEAVWVKVVSIDEETGKMGLAMKNVNQSTGTDEDPNNVSLEMDQQRRRSRPGEAPKINAEDAIGKAVCEKCGCKGHVGQQCWNMGGKKYDLIESDDDDKPTVAATRPEYIPPSNIGSAATNANLVPLGKPPPWMEKQDKDGKKKSKKKEKKKKKSKDKKKKKKDKKKKDKKKKR